MGAKALLLLNLAAAAAYTWSALRVARATAGAAVGLPFVLLSLGLASSAALSGLFTTAATPEAAALWLSLSALGWTLGPALLLHFVGSLTAADWLEQRPLTKTAVAAMLYAPALVFLGRGHVVLSTSATIARGPWGFFELPQAGAWSLGSELYCVAYAACAMGLLLRWGRREVRPVARRNASLAGAFGLATLLVLAAAHHMLPAWGARLPPLAAVALLGWHVFFTRALTRHRLIRLTPALAAPDLLRAMGDPVLLVGSDGAILFANDAACRLFGEVDPKQMNGRTLVELLPASVRWMMGPIASEPLSEELILRAPGRGELVVQATVSAAHGSKGDSLGLVVILRDVTERRRAEEQLEHAATHDALTGLPNRLLLADRARQVLNRARRFQRSAAVLMLDLNHFKEVNDTLGHATGDQLLRHVAQRLSHVVRDVDTVARLSGDEFVLLLGDLLKPSDAARVADRVHAALATSIHTDARLVNTSCSIGVAIFPTDGGDFDRLLRLADIAMYRAKEDGSQFAFFDEPMQQSLEQRVALESELGVALQRGQFRLLYQPLIDVSSRAICGVEALIRWHHPERGLISPLDFVPLAESTGSIVPIGDWVLREAARQWSSWQGEGFGDLRVCVNVSPVQLRQPGLLETLTELIGTGVIPASKLELEITESMAMEKVNELDSTLARIRALGVSLALDDFGTGYSSLARLRDLPVDTLKIDRSFMKDVTIDPIVASVVRGIIATAHSLKLQVVAEGVECAEQLEFLSQPNWSDVPEIRCDLAQGYLFGRPVAADELTALLSEQQPQPPAAKDVLARGLAESL